MAARSKLPTGAAAAPRFRLELPLRPRSRSPAMKPVNAAEMTLRNSQHQTKGQNSRHRRRSRYPRKPGDAARVWKATPSNWRRTAPKACRSSEAHAYDLVLLDLMMPDRSGMEVLRRSASAIAKRPIFMITAYGSVEVAVSALKLGANDYFSKPWDNEKLLIEIDRMIAQAPAGAREHAAQARAQAALQLPQHHRQERAHAAHAGPGGAGGAQPRPRS